MTNFDKFLIPTEYCYRHNKYYSSSDWCVECEKDIELHEMLNDIRAKLLELKEFIYENPVYNGKIIYDYEIDKMIEILGCAIVNIDI